MRYAWRGSCCLSSSGGTSLESLSIPRIPFAAGKKGRVYRALSTHSEQLLSVVVEEIYVSPIVQEVAINLFRVADVLTIGIQRNQCVKAGWRPFKYDRFYTTIKDSVVPRLFPSQDPPDGADPGNAASQEASETGFKSNGSYWLNPCGNNYSLRPGDRLIIIAPSVTVAECLQYATRLPWIPSSYGMRSFVSHFRNVGDNRPHLFSKRETICSKGSLRSATGGRCSRDPKNNNVHPPEEEDPTPLTADLPTTATTVPLSPPDGRTATAADTRIFGAFVAFFLPCSRERKIRMDSKGVLLLFPVASVQSLIRCIPRIARSSLICWRSLPILPSAKAPHL